MSLWEYLWAWSTKTVWLYHLNWNSNDSSWNSNNWTDTNISYVTWKFWQSIFFDNTWDYVTIADHSSLQFWTWNFTISFWIKLWTLCEYQKAFMLLSKNYTWYEMYLYRWNNWTDTNLCWYIWGASNIWIWTFSFQTGIWYNCILIRNWTTCNSFVNTLVDTQVTNSASASNVGTVLNFWRRPWNTPNMTPNFILDEVIIENRAWSATEIKKYYTYARGRFGII